MKQLIAILCSSVYLLMAQSHPGYADEHFPFLAEVSKESVNVRSGPSTNFEKIDKLSRGAQVVVLGRSFEWLKIEPLVTTKAYIRSDYLKKSDTDVAEVTGDNVNVRAAPSSSANALGQVKLGTLVKVVEKATENAEDQAKGIIGWDRIEPVIGTVAWIHQDFLKAIPGEIPASMMIAPITKSATTIKKTILLSVSSSMALRGRLEPLAQAPRENIHYEMIIDEKSIYYLEDIPQISSFANAVVDVQGSIVPDWQKKSMYPLVHINRISLVL